MTSGGWSGKLRRMFNSWIETTWIIMSKFGLQIWQEGECYAPHSRCSCLLSNRFPLIHLPSIEFPLIMQITYESNSCSPLFPGWITRVTLTCTKIISEDFHNECRMLFKYMRRKKCYPRFASNKIQITSTERKILYCFSLVRNLFLYAKQLNICINRDDIITWPT